SLWRGAQGPCRSVGICTGRGRGATHEKDRQAGTRHAPRYTRRPTCCSERRGSGCQSARTHQSLQDEDMGNHDIILNYQAKGIGGLAARAGTILTRFGPTPGRMEAYLTHYADLAHEFGARPTLPITACVLARHPASIARFHEEGVEFAIHGLVHNDHAA